MNPLILMVAPCREKGKEIITFEFLTWKLIQSEDCYIKTFPLGQCMIKANRSNPKIRSAIPIPGCPPTLEDLVKILRENGIEIDMEDYHSYRKHLAERYKTKPQFDPKDFFEGGK